MNPSAPVIGGVYRHYRTNREYEVIALARHTQTNEMLVICRCHNYHNPLSCHWARPLEQFVSKVTLEGKEGWEIPRFTLVHTPTLLNSPPRSPPLSP